MMLGVKILYLDEREERGGVSGEYEYEYEYKRRRSILLSYCGNCCAAVLLLLLY